jgi:hypothetical protein
VVHAALLDKFTERMVEMALSNYMPTIQKAKEQRVAELESLKSYIRSEPEKVEEWFDREIEKTKNIGSSELLKQLGTL